MTAEVVFPLPFRNSFSYNVPVSLKNSITERVRVVAPFGKRTLTGFVISIDPDAPLNKKFKEIADILDDEPVFSEAYLNFYKWLSDYYMCSLGEAIKLSVPFGFEIESKKRIITDPEFCKDLLQKEKGKESIREKVLEILSQRSQIDFSSLQKLIRKKNIYSVLSKLESEGAVTVLTELSGAKTKPRLQNFVQISQPADVLYENLAVLEERSPAQVKILLELLEKKNEDVLLTRLLKKTKAAVTSVKSLEKKGFVKVYTKEIERKYSGIYTEKIQEIKLTDPQRDVINETAAYINEKRFKPFLLHGVTGSGKTQVYIELTRIALEKGESVIILVPEISLTPQITSRFIYAFGDAVSVLHSRMSKGERFDSWRKINKAGKSIIIGARSALFAPVKSAGLIIVDEEHDQSYKQSDTIPRYNAKDAAVMLASFSGCPVILGSATPSIESMYNARSGKFNLLRLSERIDNAKLPNIQLVNILTEQKHRRMENVFSSVLLNKIEDRLKKKEGVIILQNRRGFSTQLYCSDCGEVEKCDNCSVPMVFHINKNNLECHYCGLLKPVPTACSYCGSLSVKFFGTGTERVEDEIEYYFPDAKIRRIDSDAITRKNTLSKILNEFGKGEIDILIGTQMVSKGLDFPRVTLVGVISAETSLWLPDFRADERTFQLLTQVSGRAGRSLIEGEVIIQTKNEKNFALQKVLQNDYEGFYEHEVNLRKMKSYPPFSRLCLLEFRDPDEENAKGASNDFYRKISAFRKKLEIMQPMPALISRIKGFYRYHLLVKSTRENDPGGGLLRKAVTDSLIEFNKTSRFREVRPFIDADPQSIF